MVTVSDKTRQQIAKKQQETLKSKNLHPSIARAIKNDDIPIGHTDLTFPSENQVLSGGLAQLRKHLTQAPIYDSLYASKFDNLENALNDTDNIAYVHWALVKRLPYSTEFDYSRVNELKDTKGYVLVTQQDLKADMQHIPLERHTSEGKMIAMMCVKEHRQKRLNEKNQRFQEIYEGKMQEAQAETQGRFNVKENLININTGDYG
jgi:hypothetical protein